MTATAIKDNRSFRTRDALIRAAETLFADCGIEGVSINTITRAAGQNNRNAVQYHFGSKHGLLQAIFDKHGPGLTARREALLDELQGVDMSPARRIASILVLPLVEKLDDEDGGAAYVHISAELIVSNTLSYTLPESAVFQLPRETKLVTLMCEELRHFTPEVLRQRVMLANILAFHGISDHARLRDNPALDALSRDTEFMASNLIDSVAAILDTAPSARTQSLAGGS